ncbi:MAG: hypothetical protein KGI41_01275 [Patescibacteria group bacterium]|nr:hypothetical protein [Patescibacteria group bacterium]MDE1965858.1 hypothetical protein [Patescibacteria group bacterium]
MKRLFEGNAPRVFVFDFDNTIANTAASPDSAMKGVEEASREAIGAVFGAYGTEALLKIGGAGNRSPRELIEELLQAGAAEDARSLMCGSALGYLGKHRSALMQCVPEGKGQSLALTVPATLDTMTEIFVRAKLLILLPQVGESWPRRIPGAAFFQEEAGWRGRTCGILSAGHERFITRFYETHHRKPLPMVTDDDIRGSLCKDWMKPDERLLRYALRKFGCFCVPMDDVLYLGDDLVRDGLMAKAAGTRFGWYNPAGRAPATPLWDGAFEFRRYDELSGAIFGTAWAVRV